MNNFKIRRTDIDHNESLVRSIGLMNQLPLLVDAGLVSCGIDWRSPHCHWGDLDGRTNLVFFAVEGMVVPEDAPESGCLSEGELVIVPPGKRYFTNQESPAILLWFHFQAGAEWDFLTQEAYRPRQASHIAILHATMEALLEEQTAFAGQGALAQEAAERLSGLLLHYLKRELVPQSPAAEREARLRLARLWNLVRGTPDKPWDVTALAREVHMSEGYFSRMVRKLYGEPPMQMVLRLRMEHAAMRLQTSSKGLDEIAAEAGYKTAYAFSDAFLRYSGQRPGKYRSGKP